MFQLNFWMGMVVFLGVNSLFPLNAHAYNQADLDAAERGLQGRKVMADFLSVYKGDPSQLANRKDLLYISYEMIRRMERGEESLTQQLKAIDQKLIGLTGGTGKTGPSTSPALEKKVDLLTDRITLMDGKIARLSTTSVGNGSPNISTANVEKEVKTILPALLQQDSRIQMMEKEITALKKDQKTDRKGSDLNSQVETARLIAGTSIAVTLFTVLFMAR